MASNRRKVYEDFTQDENSEGIPCSNCGCRHSYVLKTQRLGEITRRLRRCRHCGRTFFTVETA